MRSYKLNLPQHQEESAQMQTLSRPMPSLRASVAARITRRSVVASAIKSSSIMAGAMSVVASVAVLASGSSASAADLALGAQVFNGNW
jgi:hypothetical protein